MERLNSSREVKERLPSVQKERPKNSFGLFYTGTGELSAKSAKSITEL